MTEPFNGAKAATFIGDKLLVILRDDRDDIPYPAMWDFPGGGREAGETGLETLAREMMEEVGLVLSGGTILWSALLPSVDVPGTKSWFYVVRFPPAARADIRFGNEGQRWELADVEDVLARSDLVPSLSRRLRLWLNSQN